MDIVYQKKPLRSKPSQYPAKSWTDTVEGYLNEAKQLTMCILRNRRLMRRPYTWLVTINFEVELEPSRIATLWTKISRKMREQGVVAIWVREPSRANKVHHHLLLRNPIDRANLERIVEESMPSRKQVKWHKNLKENRDELACRFLPDQGENLRGHRRAVRRGLLRQEAVALPAPHQVAEVWDDRCVLGEAEEVPLEGDR